MASHRLSLLTQREPDSLGRNSICLRSFHRCGEHDRKSRAARSAMSRPTQYVSRELVSAFLPKAQVENRRVRERKDERDRADHVSADGNCARVRRSTMHRTDASNFETRDVSEEPGAAAVLDIRARESCSVPCGKRNADVAWPEATSPTGRRLQEPEVPIGKWQLERSMRLPFSGRIVVDSIAFD